MAAQKCHSVPALLSGKLNNQTCELQRQTTQIGLVMNEAAPLMAHVQVRGAHFKSYYDMLNWDGHFSRRIPISHNGQNVLARSVSHTGSWKMLNAHNNASIKNLICAQVHRYYWNRHVSASTVKKFDFFCFQTEHYPPTWLVTVIMGWLIPQWSWPYLWRARQESHFLFQPVTLTRCLNEKMESYSPS